MFRINSLSCAIATCLVSVNIAWAQPSDVQQAVDANSARIEAALDAAGLIPIAKIDHARLAAEEGVKMPPSQVHLFSDPSINTSMLQMNIRSGLDIPFRVLSYSQDDAPSVAYTDSEFLKIRHGLDDTSVLDAFDGKLSDVIEGFGGNAMATPTENLTPDYGIIELSSKLSVAEAVSKLTQTIKSQGDTIWFGEIDFAAQASELGVKLPFAVLLLFGGPKPGGVAMADFPAIGLDAFCQKLLIYAGPNGGSIVIFNDIAALAELHYGVSAKPHHALNERLTATFKSAIE